MEFKHKSVLLFETIDNLNIDADDVVLPVNNAGDWHNYQHVILKNVHLKTGENVLKFVTTEVFKSVTNVVIFVLICVQTAMAFFFNQPQFL